ncbi:MAG: nucleotidyltransferase domain-containing protein [Candidatus Chisholmbacteria bacterium]|nr:nucleotidyltransferase domain-containing protein [Candidatus Chisholmbacteria bacterium]
MDQATITQSLKSYLTKLNKFVSVDEAYLFGSSSSGTAKEDSDIDLLILSKDFSKYDPDTRLKIIYRASSGFPYDLHAYGVTPDEYASASPLTTLGAIRSTNPPAIQI